MSLLQMGTRQVLKTLEILTGSEFIRECSDFFRNIEKWQGQLENRTQLVHQMLTAPSTQFCLVTSFDAAKLQEAEAFAREIKKNGYSLTSVLLNRAFPDWLLPQDVEKPKTEVEKEILRLSKLLKVYYEHRLELYDKFERKLSSEVTVYKLPDFLEPISDLQGLSQLGQYFTWEKK